MIIFTDDIPTAWYGKTLHGPDFDLKIVGPFNCSSVEVVNLKDATKSSFPIVSVALALLKGTVTLTQD